MILQCSPEKYVFWADKNRKALSRREGADGIFAPAVNPNSWLEKTKFNKGSPEGQAFVVHLYTAYRDCINAKVCAPSTPIATTISHPGIGPIDILTVFYHAVTYTAFSPYWMWTVQKL